MTSFLIGVAIFLGLMLTVVAYISFGNFLKFILLWIPVGGCLLVGLIASFILPAILSVFVVIVCIVGAYKTYEEWEFSDTYSRIEKRIDDVFMSK